MGPHRLPGWQGLPRRLDMARRRQGLLRRFLLPLAVGQPPSVMIFVVASAQMPQMSKRCCRMADLPPSVQHGTEVVYDRRLLVQINLRPLIHRLATLLGG